MLFYLICSNEYLNAFFVQKIQFSYNTKSDLDNMNIVIKAISTKVMITVHNKIALVIIKCDRVQPLL